MTKKISAVVFDLDNTLVSSSLNFKAIKEYFGCPNDEDILEFVERLPVEEEQFATQKLHQFEMEDALTAEKLPFTDKVIRLLDDLKIPYAIVTRNNFEAATYKVNNNDINIPMLISREQFTVKPAPDALLYLANYWNVPAENILYVGDYLYDIQMANNANTQSCLVSYGKYFPFADLASFVVKDLNQLGQVLTENHRDHFGVAQSVGE
jgi:HAD superfamily hydrolase (TIGR01549 family)